MFLRDSTVVTWSQTKTNTQTNKQTSILILSLSEEKKLTNIFKF